MLIETATAVAAGVGMYSMLIEPRWFRLYKKHVRLKPAPLPEIDILHLSDLHLYKGRGEALPFLRKIARQEYDFIFVTGDLIENNSGIPLAAEALKPFRARYGKFAVLGNHDYYHTRFEDVFRKTGGLPVNPESKLNDIPRLIDEMANIGVEVLRNERRDVPLGDNGVTIAGVDDPYVARDDIRATFDGFSKTGPLFVLVHSPEKHPEIAPLNPDMVFSGHTHGGQVCLPFIGPITTRSKAPRRYAKGLLRENGTVFYTSRGVGTGRLTRPRFWCPPEATLFRVSFDA